MKVTINNKETETQAKDRKGVSPGTRFASYRSCSSYQ